MIRRLTPFLLLGLVLLTGCSSARVSPIDRGQALRDRTPREVKVVKVWDQVNDRLDGPTDPQISHYIEVDVLDGPEAGKPMTLPYDRWNTGKEPPSRGDRLVVAPMDWVSRDPHTNGRPYGSR